MVFSGRYTLEIGGPHNPRVVCALGELVRSRQPDILFLCQNLVHADKIEELKSKLKFEAGFCVNRISRGGGRTAVYSPPFLK